MWNLLTGISKIFFGHFEFLSKTRIFDKNCQSIGDSPSPNVQCGPKIKSELDSQNSRYGNRMPQGDKNSRVIKTVKWMGAIAKWSLRPRAETAMQVEDNDSDLTNRPASLMSNSGRPPGASRLTSGSFYFHLFGFFPSQVIIFTRKLLVLASLENFFARKNSVNQFFSKKTKKVSKLRVFGL